jgi:glycosyltransferase involved in cell wall biosynthesis
MSAGPLFSVVIPTFNRAELLRQTLDSVFAQEFTDYEVIVVDDGSTDATPRVLTEHGERLVALRQMNLGPSAARNLGLTRARGRYVCTLDSDDVWFPWTLATIAHAIEGAGAPSLIAGKLLPFRHESDLRAARPAEPKYELYPDYLASSHKGYFVGSCMAFYERQALVRSGAFDPELRNMEDHDLSLRLGTAPGFVKVTDPVTLGYRHHEGSIQSVTRATAALRVCLARERDGRYPGGRRRASERRRLLSLHARPLSVACLRERRPDLGWRIFAETLAWNARQARVRYLVGFPLLGLRVCASTRTTPA